MYSSGIWAIRPPRGQILERPGRRCEVSPVWAKSTAVDFGQMVELIGQ
jgi:hypothetical protein